jgi:hypothetical protein
METMAVIGGGQNGNTDERARAGDGGGEPLGLRCRCGEAKGGK